MPKLQLLPCLDFPDMAALRRQELDISRDDAVTLGRSTLEALRQGYYIAETGRRVDWQNAVQTACSGKVSIAPHTPLPNQKKIVCSETRVQVSNETTMGAAYRLAERGLNPLALNFANGVQPGGGFLGGAKAQEEVLCRSSALYQTLAGDPMYESHRQRTRPDSTDWTIYSPNVPIFRKDDGTALEHFWLLSFLTCAAPYQPAIGQPEAGNLLQLRIHRILAIARSYGYTALVLGAWGCGAFANDPYRTAVDFRDALENDFSGTFSDIVFAITDWTPERRFLGPFRGVFSIEQTDKTSSVNATPTANCNSSNFCSLAQDNSVVQESLNHRRECLNGFINILRYFKMRKIMERTKDWFGGLFLGQDAIQRKNTGELFRHRKIIVHESEFGHPVFADWYEPINTQENGKVYIIYLGGAIDKETYLSRTKTEPVVLRDIFFDTLNELKRFDICLLVIATPHGRNRCAKKMLGVFSDLLCNRFLPEVQARPDDCAAIIGNSLGAYFGLGLLPVLHGIHSFVSFGGAWMVEAAVQCNLSPENINWSLFSNSGDQLKAHIQGFVNWLRLRKVEAKLINRNRNHSFSSYLSNRSVRDGFMKALTLPRA